MRGVYPEDGTLSHRPIAPPPRRATFRRVKGNLVRRLKRVLLIAFVIAVAGPFVLVLPLNFIQPLTTMVMLRRAMQRLGEGTRPVYPRRDVVSRNDISPHLRRAVLASDRGNPAPHGQHLGVGHLPFELLKTLELSFEHFAHVRNSLGID